MECKYTKANITGEKGSKDAGSIHPLNEQFKIRPFLKWAGGKKQLLKDIEKYYPFNETINKYAEPFVGGGAVLFDILNKFELEQIYISDVNKHLINAYRMVRDNVESLIECLQILQAEFLSLDSIRRKEYYLQRRSDFNTGNLLTAKRQGEHLLSQAALLIFLNKTCYNGLYRVNKKGLFNVPMGVYKNPLICDSNNLIAISQKLRGVEIVCGDYTQSLTFVDQRTFVYFDPPYRPLTQTSNFTAYAVNNFDDLEQKRLANFVELVSAKGAKILVSNSDPKNINNNDDFFENIYSNYRINRVTATRMINCKGTERGELKELLISNF